QVRILFRPCRPSRPFAVTGCNAPPNRPPGCRIAYGCGALGYFGLSQRGGFAKLPGPVLAAWELWLRTRVLNGCPPSGSRGKRDLRLDRGGRSYLEFVPLDGVCFPRAQAVLGYGDPPGHPLVVPLSCRDEHSKTWCP